MTYRTRNVMIAAGLAVLAVVFMMIYLSQVRGETDLGKELVSVFVASRDIGEGTPGSSITINLSAGSAPSAPTGLSSSIVDGLPKLDWTAVGGAKFYRIYRDCTLPTAINLSCRYDETITSSPTYTDPNPGSSTLHTYWVTAVDDNFNESQPSLPVISPGP